MAWRAQSILSFVLSIVRIYTMTYDCIVFVYFCLFSSLSWTLIYFNWRKSTSLMLGYHYRFVLPLLVPTIIVKIIYELTRKFMTDVFQRIIDNQNNEPNINCNIDRLQSETIMIDNWDFVIYTLTIFSMHRFIKVDKQSSFFVCNRTPRTFDKL